MTVRTAIVLLLLPLADVAFAQDGRTASVAGTVSAMNIESDTAPSFSGSFEYRFNRVVSLEIDATLAVDLKVFPRGYPVLAGSSFTFTSGSAAPTIFPGPTLTNEDGRAVILSNNVRVVIPTTVARLEPYFVAGGGIASLRQTADLIYSPILATLTPELVATGVRFEFASNTVVVPPRPIRPFTQRVTSSSINLALTLGGGLSVRTTSHLWIDADLRLFRLLGNEDRNVGRFGVGARYTF
jgi:opacity protein-like surface antigen